MAKLSTATRKRLPASDFAGKGRSYPIEDPEHGRKAVQLGARAVKAGTLSKGSYAKIKAKVRRRYPKIGRKRRAETVPLRRLLHAG